MTQKLKHNSVGVALLATLALSACSHGRNFALGGSDGGGASSKTTSIGGDAPGGNPGGDPGDGGGTYTPGSVGTTANLVTETSSGLLYQTGNAVIGLGDATDVPIVSNVLRRAGDGVADLGADLDQNGLGAVPVVGSTLSGAVYNADHLTGDLANVTVVDLGVITGPTGAAPAVGVAALNGAPVNGQLASVNGLPTNGAGQLANTNLNGSQVLGDAGTPGAVNPALNTNQLAPTVNNTLGNVGSTLNGVTNGLPGGSVVSGLTNIGGAGSPNGGLSGVTGTVNGLTGGLPGAPGAAGGLGGTVNGVTSGLSGLLGG